MKLKAPSSTAITSVGTAFLLFLFVGKLDIPGLNRVYLFYLAPIILSLVAVIRSMPSPASLSKSGLLLTTLFSTIVFSISILNRSHAPDLIVESIASSVTAISAMWLGFVVAKDGRMSASASKNIRLLFQFILALAVIVLTTWFSLNHSFIDLYYFNQDLDYSYQSISFLTTFFLFLYLISFINSNRLAVILGAALAYSFSVFSGIIGSIYGVVSFALAALLILLIYLIENARKVAQLIGLIAILAPLSFVFFYNNLISSLERMRSSEALSAGLFGLFNSSSFASRVEIRNCFIQNLSLVDILMGSDGLCQGVAEHSFLGLIFQVGLIPAILYMLYLIRVLFKSIPFLLTAGSAKPNRYIVILFAFLPFSLLFQRWPSALFYLIIGFLHGFRVSNGGGDNVFSLGFPRALAK